MQHYVNVPVMGYGFTPNSATIAADGGTIPLGTTLMWVMPIPSDNLGGGITVTEFKPYCHGTIAANKLDVSLVTLGTADDVVGTVAHCGSAVFGYGGTMNYYNKLGTVVNQQSTGYWCDQDEGHYGLAIQLKQVAVLAVGTINLSFSIGYQQGR
jgi:hypothetical protein